MDDWVRTHNDRNGQLDLANFYASTERPEREAGSAARPAAQLDERVTVTVEARAAQRQDSASRVRGQARGERRGADGERDDQDRGDAAHEADTVAAESES